MHTSHMLKGCHKESYLDPVTPHKTRSRILFRPSEEVQSGLVFCTVYIVLGINIQGLSLEPEYPSIQEVPLEPHRKNVFLTAMLFFCESGATL